MRGEKYLRLNDGWGPECETVIAEQDVASLVLFLQTCGETWKASAPASPTMVSR